MIHEDLEKVPWVGIGVKLTIGVGIGVGLLVCVGKVISSLLSLV